MMNPYACIDTGTRKKLAVLLQGGLNLKAPRQPVAKGTPDAAHSGTPSPRSERRGKE